MAKATAETLVTVLIPDKNKIVLSPPNRAEVTIRGMAPSRRLGAGTNLRRWHIINRPFFMQSNTALARGVAR
jgi:hypothetical protein